MMLHSVTQNKDYTNNCNYITHQADEMEHSCIMPAAWIINAYSIVQNTNRFAQVNGEDYTLDDFIFCFNLSFKLKF